MIIDKDTTSIIVDGYIVNYKGVLFLKDKEEGEASIREIIKVIINTGKIDFESIFGNYYLHIENVEDNTHYVFVDNSGIFKAYKDSEIISTSLLSILEEGKKEYKLDARSIVEFLYFGFVYGNKTLVEGVEKIDADYYYKVKNNEIEKISKGLKDIEAKPKVKFDAFFEKLPSVFKSQDVSIDLTGGFDSRLIMSYFYRYGKSYELAISGQKGNKDIEIAGRLAEMTNKEFYPTYHDSSNLSFKELRQIFNDTDGQIDVVDFHRNFQLIKDRLKRGKQLHISGAGGELYKDFWWLQDFPFYKRKKADIKKLYDLRIRNRAFSASVLSDRLMNIYLKMDDNNVKYIEKFTSTTNTQTYDKIYYHYKMSANAGSYITATNNYIKSYAPLLERDLVKTGYNLDRKMRFFNFFHKVKITNNSSRIARIATTEGISSSSEKIYLIRDVFFYFKDKAKRGTKLILRKVTGKTFLQESPVNSEVVKHWKNSKEYKKAVHQLKEMAILSRTVNSDDISEGLVGRIITLSMLADKGNVKL